MRISTKGRYGLRACLELASRFGEKAIQTSKIAKARDIPEKYLAQIVHNLKKAGLVKSSRGARGGYTLARSPSDIHVGEVVEALEGSLSPVECVERPGSCARVPVCATRALWCQLSDSISKTLNSVTLEDLIKIEKEGKSPEQMYYI
jgi:Rrf2 family protein